MNSRLRSLCFIGVAIGATACHLPATQRLDGLEPAQVHIANDAEAYLLIDRDSTVRYDRVRLVGDTVYGWEHREDDFVMDSVAIALNRIHGIEQQRLALADTLSVVGFGLLLLGAAFLALLAGSVE